jgi:YegS/Rv2252/BmrU family lipid kinase
MLAVPGTTSLACVISLTQADFYLPFFPTFQARFPVVRYTLLMVFSKSEKDEQFSGSLLILNGKSAGDDMLREAIHLLRGEGMDIQVRVTWEKGDAERYVAEAIALGVETVIAGGGDGTINEVASALVHSESDHTPVLGILPLGTANDFATSAGIPETLDKALQLAIVGKAVPIDIAEVNDKTCFINMATGGFGTHYHRNARKTESRAGWCLLHHSRPDAHGHA